MMHQRRFLALETLDDELLDLLRRHGYLPSWADTPDLRVFRIEHDALCGRLQLVVESDHFPECWAYNGHWPFRHLQWGASIPDVPQQWQPTPETSTPAERHRAAADKRQKMLGVLQKQTAVANVVAHWLCAIANGGGDGKANIPPGEAPSVASIQWMLCELREAEAGAANALREMTEEQRKEVAGGE